jgi:predicted AlkP superfamily pyrophosphatase or phosphodiesterase
MKENFRRRFLRVLAGAAVAVLLGSCVNVPSRAPAPLLLISLDAFRWDYCALHPDETPHLRRLAREGISAKQLIPVYPSNTFPNHYTLVTGLYPSHHGIINNEFFDPTLGEFFHYNRIVSSQKSQWWGGEPVWVTAIRQGKKSASSFWVGSEAEIHGVRPTFWKPYSADVPFAQRFEELFGWLHLPLAERPAVITFYFEPGNSIGHKYGPDSPELVATLKTLDGQVGAMVDRLQHDGIPANIVIVSDHGMTPISPERVLLLDAYLDPTKVQVDFDGPVAGLRPLEGDASALLDKLVSLPHAKAYAREKLPARFHITDNPRNPPVWIVPEEGWEIYFRTRFEQYRAKFNHGDHGYDPRFESMRGILIAHGPAFKSNGQVIDPVDNVHVYNLLCAALKLTPAPNDGDDRLVRAMLR